MGKKYKVVFFVTGLLLFGLMIFAHNYLDGYTVAEDEINQVTIDSMLEDTTQFRSVEIRDKKRIGNYMLVIFTADTSHDTDMGNAYYKRNWLTKKYKWVSTGYGDSYFDTDIIEVKEHGISKEYIVVYGGNRYGPHNTLKSFDFEFMGHHYEHKIDTPYFIKLFEMPNKEIHNENQFETKMVFHTEKGIDTWENWTLHSLKEEWGFY